MADHVDEFDCFNFSIRNSISCWSCGRSAACLVASKSSAHKHFVAIPFFPSIVNSLFSASSKDLIPGNNKWNWIIPFSVWKVWINPSPVGDKGIISSRSSHRPICCLTYQNWPNHWLEQKNPSPLKISAYRPIAWPVHRWEGSGPPICWIDRLSLPPMIYLSGRFVWLNRFSTRWIQHRIWSV